MILYLARSWSNEVMGGHDEFDEFDNHVFVVCLVGERHVSVMRYTTVVTQLQRV